MPIIFSIALMIAAPSYAQELPLRVAVDNFAYPFVMRGANNQLFGFDIDLMTYICKRLNRQCEYIPMPFNKLLQAVKEDKADVALGSITITETRKAYANFSTPYLVSMSQFIGLKKLSKKPFSWASLNNKKIGLSPGTFREELSAIGVINPTIYVYDKDAPALEDLKNGVIDFLLMESPTALYWQNHASGRFRVLGDPFNYGLGYGVAVNQRNTQLLQAINAIINDYIESQGFKSSYNKYLANF